MHRRDLSRSVSVQECSCCLGEAFVCISVLLLIEDEEFGPELLRPLLGDSNGMPAIAEQTEHEYVSLERRSTGCQPGEPLPKEAHRVAAGRQCEHDALEQRRLFGHGAKDSSGAAGDPHGPR